MSFDELVEVWSKKRILVVGDAMVDIDLYSSFVRPSNELGGPILREQKRILAPGGAANVAMNVKYLGPRVSLIAPIGTDENGQWLLGKLKDEKIDVASQYFTACKNWTGTTVKTRIYNGSQAVCRVDKDYHQILPHTSIRSVLENSSYDALLISDYQKGALFEGSQQLVANFRMRNPTALVAANAKPSAVKSLMGRIDMLSVNDEEYKQMEGAHEEELSLIQKLGISALLHTRGWRGLVYAEKGIYLPSKEPRIERVAVDGYDVDRPDFVGAGDSTFVAGALALLCSAEPDMIAKVANAAGAAKVVKQGTQPISPADMAVFLNR